MAIGRSSSNHLVLADPQVSQRHAEIWPFYDGYSITDKGSATGTFVNRHRLTPDIPHALTSGDEVRIGQITLIYEETGRDAGDNQFDLQEGVVPEEGAYINIYCLRQSSTAVQEHLLLARLAPGTGKAFVVQFFVDPDQADPWLTSAFQAARRDLEHFLRSYSTVMSWEFAVRRCDRWPTLTDTIVWWFRK